MNFCNRTAADGAEHLELERRFLHHDGDYRTLSMVIRLEYDASYRPVDVIGYALDVTARQAAEQRVIDRTAELEAANRELEAFSYAVSHDLRAPLRSINGFSQALLEDAAARLDEQDKDYLRRIRGATQRMAQLIEALLALSRITRAELQRQDLDLSAMAKAIAADLQRQEPMRQVAFVIADGLRAAGDPRLLRVALENLLGNAWKFTAKRPQACIEVGRLRQPDGTQVFFVRDNGAGFEMALPTSSSHPFNASIARPSMKGQASGWPHSNASYTGMAVAPGRRAPLTRGPPFTSPWAKAPPTHKAMAAFFIQTYGMTVGDAAVPLIVVGIGAMLGNLLGGLIVSLARG